MLERRDRVSAASVMYCDVPLSYWVPWVLEKLQLWYGVFGTTLEQNLKEPLEIPFAIKGLREPACCCIFGTELLLTVGLQPSCSISWRFIPGQSRQASSNDGIKHLMILDCLVAPVSSSGLQRAVWYWSESRGGGSLLAAGQKGAEHGKSAVGKPSSSCCSECLMLFNPI